MQRASKLHTQSGIEFLHAVENVAIKLTSDCDWTTRITALQRLEGLVIGGEKLVTLSWMEVSITSSALCLGRKNLVFRVLHGTFIYRGVR